MVMCMRIRLVIFLANTCRHSNYIRLVEYFSVRCIAVSSIPKAPGYLTDRFVLNTSVHDCHPCNCTNIPTKKYNLSSGQCKFVYKFTKLSDTIPECIQNASSVDIFKTHILTVSHERYTHLQAFHDSYERVCICIWLVDWLVVVVRICISYNHILFLLLLLLFYCYNV